MRPHRSAPAAEIAGTTGSPADVASFPPVEPGRKPEAGRRGAGHVFRRKIDCGSSTETSAERLVLRDPDHLLRSRRRQNR